jgi:putative ABC transport system permease protein
MVLRRILQETVTVSVAGILIGLAGALATTRLVAAFLFELSPRDPSTLLATAVVLMATTMAAGWLPARRAAAVDPMRALRNE